MVRFLLLPRAVGTTLTAQRRMRLRPLLQNVKHVRLSSGVALRAGGTTEADVVNTPEHVKDLRSVVGQM